MPRVEGHSSRLHSSKCAFNFACWAGSKKILFLTNALKLSFSLVASSSMLDQRRVPMRSELFQQPLFVQGCGTWRTLRRPANPMQRSKALPFQILISGFGAPSVQPGDVSPGLSSLCHHHSRNSRRHPRPPTGFMAQ
ncbi:hypothetical protein SAMN00790413_02587 [Deinococcus hopiensis KR-140]|uniref:Uncharacterized protein n=1 Tax=Deinococcus hopiensis KR-140 TaxID=695939 RepID=A0A1W1VNH7_9DEIO|nr:hypothetical protein SAMN00790413_02587 [Deinococcus hopiensis KR-140]